MTDGMRDSLFAMSLVSNRQSSSTVSSGPLADVVHRLVDEITYKKATEATDAATQSAILGPFFQADNPVLKKGGSIYHTKVSDAEVVYMYGRVTDSKTGAPLVNTAIDIWQASTNGKLDICRQDVVLISCRSLPAAR